MKKLLVRWSKGLSGLGAALLLVGILSAFTLHTSDAANATHVSKGNVQSSNSFKFKLVASAGITSCLPNARGSVKITPGELNDRMEVSVSGLAPNTGYDLFVTEIPNKPFGVAWYQSDLQTDSRGAGSVSVRGIFNIETFSVSTGGPTTTFAPTHQYHLGLWFNDPQVPFKLGCEPGKTSPIVTPFNGEQHAGIQVLNTSNFPDNAGPLSHVSK
jgi:hypothetical protein